MALGGDLGADQKVDLARLESGDQLLGGVGTGQGI